MNVSTELFKQLAFALTVLVVTFLVTRIFRFLIGKFVRAASIKLKVDPTKYNFFKNATDFLLYLIALIIIFRGIPSLRAYGTALFAGAGVLAAILGFASQSAFSNIVSGIFIVIFRPFSVGDRVRLSSNFQGDVIDITLRHTVIRDFENRRIVIPNSVINNETVINSTLQEELLCVFVEVPVAFDADLDKAMNIMRQEAESHPTCRDARTPEEVRSGHPKVMTRLISLGEYAALLRASVYAPDPNAAFEMKCQLLKSILTRFLREGIEVPYPHRTLINKRETQ
jgi:small-conductance mechanosensitive channel